MAWMLALWGCTSSVSQFGPGLDLSIQVAGAQLQNGPIGPDRGGPTVSQVLRPQPEVLRGETGVALNGRLAPGGVALHLQAEGDDDHWVLPAQGFDFVVADELQFSAELSISHAVPKDRIPLRLAAADADGRLGPVFETELLLRDDLPPAVLLVSLAWDAPADVDLHVVDPDGVVIGAKDLNSLPAPNGPIADPDGWMQGGYLDFDSNQQCRLDLRNRENIIWLNPPPSGRYQIFAHLFSPCDHPAVNMVAVAQLDSEVVARAGTTQYPFDSRVHFAEGEVPGLWLAEFEVP
ncbi:MAG: hypothetical protein AAGA48_33485 [Myxococcota bacterium]